MTVQDQVYICCVAIYEQQNEEVLRYLPQERAETVRKELKKFDRFPKEVRLTMALKLLGHLVQHVQNPHLEMIHPTWIAEILRKEDPQLVFDVLEQFPPDYAREVMLCLGGAEQPVENPLASLSADTVHVILRLLSQHFESMAAPLGEPDLTLETLYLLRQEDLITILKYIGILEIARALILAGKDVLAALVSRFPAEMHDEFLNALKIAKDEPTEKQKTATRRLSKIDLPSHPLEEATLKIGLMKAGSVLHQNQALARKIAQRLPMNLGLILLQAEQEAATADETQEIMAVIGNLIAENKVDGNSVRTRFSAASERLSLRLGS